MTTCARPNCWCHAAARALHDHQRRLMTQAELRRHDQRIENPRTGKVNRWPNPDDVDEVVVQRILDGDPGPAHAATPAEKRAVVAAWRAAGRPLSDLARLTGWKPERYTRPARQEAA